QNYKFKLRNDQQARGELFGNFVLANDPASATAVYLARHNPVAIASMVGDALRVDGGIAGSADILAFGYQADAAILAEVRKLEVREIVPLDATVVASG